jgi:hypothetical protein
MTLGPKSIHNVGTSFISTSKEAISEEDNATVIWYHKSVLLVDIVFCGDTVTAERCCGTLERLWQAICCKDVWIAVPRCHHFAQQHQVSCCQLDLSLVTALWLEVVDHPAYSSSLVLSDFHFFWSLKKT